MADILGSYVRISNEDKIMLLPLDNGLLNISMLRKYYPHAIGLKYTKTRDVITVNFSHEYMEIDLGIDVYHIRSQKDIHQNIIVFKNLGPKILKYFKANYSYDDICSLLLKKHNCKISLRTLERFFKTKNIKRKNVNESSVQEITTAIFIELESSGYNLGYRSLWQRLQKEYDLIVKQKTVLKILQIIDPEGIAARKRNRLRRRNYTSPGPNFLWHLDGYDKLKRFGFPIHGCIDGFSKKLLWLEVAETNNDPQVIAHFYLKTIEKYECLPTIVRSDRGTENCIIENLQKCLRFTHDDDFAGEESFIMGKSTAYQRIESSWCQLRKHVAGFYINFFKHMESKNILDIGNTLHVASLRHCFGPLIEHDLQLYRKEWNEHWIRKQNNRNISGGKPNLLYYLPEKYGAAECKKLFNNDHVQILKRKYVKIPKLYTPRFSDVVKEVIPNPLENCTPENALKMYVEIITNLET